MSRGKFEYLDLNYNWDSAIAETEKAIRYNPEDYSTQTIKELCKGLKHFRAAVTYLSLVDGLLSWDFGEELFHKMMKIRLKKLKRRKRICRAKKFGKTEL